MECSFQEELVNIDSFRKRVFGLSSQSTSGRRIMAIDYGTKKIGVAVSDDSMLIAFPKDILIGNWLNIEFVIRKVDEQINKYNAIAVVFGLPRTLNGALHENCKIIIPVAKCLNTTIPVLLIDERFTTRLANRQMYEKISFCRKNKRNINKINNKNDDDVSAVIILNDVLNMINASEIN